MDASPPSDLQRGFIRACGLAELTAKGRILVQGRHAPVLVVHDRGRVFALDNRCPHMGFPLERGSIEDGILTCHWHHARFDLASGCTFDLWADDVPTCPVEVREGRKGDAEVWIDPTVGHAEPARRWRGRLDDGLAHNLGLVIAKAVQGQLLAGLGSTEIVRQAALFGVRNRDDWATGATILVALGNLLPVLAAEETHLALFHGCRRVASDCDGEAPHRSRAPLASRPDRTTLERWLRHWSAVRHREGAERTLLTAVASGASPAVLARLLYAAATDRVFADGGHTLDFINKACECLDLIGWEHADAVLPSVVGPLVSARGANESTAWRHPVDLVALCDETAATLSGLFARRREVGQGERAASPANDAERGLTPWQDHRTLALALLGDGPNTSLAAIVDAVRTGAQPADLGRALAYAAARRVAQFGNANEHGDWETAHHVFTHANAVHQMLKRIEAHPEGRRGENEDDNSEDDDGEDDDGWRAVAVRGVLHGAMAIHLARFLNVPPARLPGDDGDRLDELPATSEGIGAALLDAFDRQRQVDLAARLVARHCLLELPSQALITTLAQCLLREDAGFHAYQMLEAGVRQFHEWGDTAEGRHVLIAVARYLAAHSPTERAAYQTADIARRLLQGGDLHRQTTGEGS